MMNDFWVWGDASAKGFVQLIIKPFLDGPMKSSNKIPRDPVIIIYLFQIYGHWVNILYCVAVSEILINKLVELRFHSNNLCLDSYRPNRDLWLRRRSTEGYILTKPGKNMEWMSSSPTTNTFKFGIAAINICHCIFLNGGYNRVGQCSSNLIKFWFCVINSSHSSVKLNGQNSCNTSSRAKVIGGGAFNIPLGKWLLRVKENCFKCSKTKSVDGRKP